MFSRGFRCGTGFAGDGGVSGLSGLFEIAELNRLNEFARGIDSVLGELEEEFDAVKVLASAYGFDVSSYEARFRDGVAEVRDLASALLNAGTVEEKERLYGDIQAKLRDLRSIIRGLRRVVESYNRGRLRSFGEGVDDAVLTKGELRRIVSTWFLKARSALRYGLRQVIASVIPPKIYVFGAEMDNPTYVLVCSIADARVDSVLGSVSVFIDWVLSNDVFADAASVVLRAIYEGWVVWKAILVLMVYKFFEAVNAVLSWLSRSVHWFIDSIGSVLGLPSELVSALKDIYDHVFYPWATVARGMLAFLAGAVEDAVRDFANTAVGRALLYIQELLKNALESLVTDFVMFLFRSAVSLVSLVQNKLLAEKLGIFIHYLLEALRTVLPSVARSVEYSIMMSALPFFFTASSGCSDSFGRESLANSYNYDDLKHFVSALSTFEGGDEVKTLVLKALGVDDANAIIFIKFDDIYYLLQYSDINVYDYIRDQGGEDDEGNRMIVLDQPIVIDGKTYKELSFEEAIEFLAKGLISNENDKNKIINEIWDIINSKLSSSKLWKKSRYFALDGQQFNKIMAGTFIDRGIPIGGKKALYRGVFLETENGKLIVRGGVVHGLQINVFPDGNYDIRLIKFDGTFDVLMSAEIITKDSNVYFDIHHIFEAKSDKGGHQFSPKNSALKRRLISLGEVEFSEARYIGAFIYPPIIDSNVEDQRPVKLDGVYIRRRAFRDYVRDRVKEDTWLKELYIRFYNVVVDVVNTVASYFKKVSEGYGGKISILEAIHGISERIIPVTKREDSRVFKSIIFTARDRVLCNEFLGLYLALGVGDDITLVRTYINDELFKMFGDSVEDVKREFKEKLIEHLRSLESTEKIKINRKEYPSIYVRDKNGFSDFELKYILLAPGGKVKDLWPRIRILRRALMAYYDTHVLYMRKQLLEHGLRELFEVKGLVIRNDLIVNLPPARDFFTRAISDYYVTLGDEISSHLKQLYGKGDSTVKKNIKIYHIILYKMMVSNTEYFYKIGKLLTPGDKAVLYFAANMEYLRRDESDYGVGRAGEDYMRAKKIAESELGVGHLESADEIIVKEVKDVRKYYNEEKKEELIKKRKKNDDDDVIGVINEGNLGNVGIMAAIVAIIMNVGIRLGIELLDMNPDISEVIHNTGTEVMGAKIGLHHIFALVAWALLDLDDVKDAIENIAGSEGGGSFLKSLMMVFLGAFLTGIEYHGILSGSPYAGDPSDVPGILAGLICPGYEWFFNDYVYPVLMYVVQIIAMGGPVSFVVGSLVGMVVSQALESIL